MLRISMHLVELILTSCTSILRIVSKHQMVTRALIGRGARALLAFGVLLLSPQTVAVL